MTTITNINTAPVSKPPLGQQLSFMSALPCDVAMEIFAHLTQRDCLTCMSACRDWYYGIPQYTQNIWRELHFTGHEIRVDHQRRQRCLGSHVKRITLKAGPPVTLMKRLVDWGCTKIEYLGKTDEYEFYVRVLLYLSELESCVTEDQFELIDWLRQLGCINHLRLEHHRSSISVLSVMNALPKLTHLTYTTTPTIQCLEDEEVVQQPTSLSLDTQYTKITYLCLINDMITKKQLEWVLKRCPMLRHLIIAPTSSSKLLSPSSCIIDLTSLFTWCPEVAYLALGLHTYFSPFKKIEYPLGSTGLRYLDTAGFYGIDQLVRCLVKHQSTLEHLLIASHDDIFHFDWSPVLQSLRLPNLYALVLMWIECTASSLIAMLDQCPALETLDLLFADILHIELSVFQAIRIMYHLVNLRLENIVIDARCIPTVLGQFPALEELYIYCAEISFQLPAHFECPAHLKVLILSQVDFTQIDIDVSNHDTVPMVFFQRFTRNSNLEIISVSDIKPKLGLETLKSLAMIPTLIELEISQRDTNLSSEKSLELIRTLGKTRIENLKLQLACGLTFDVLHALATLSLLRTFHAGLRYNISTVYTHVDKEGLQRMLCTSPSLVTVELQDMMLVDNGKQLKFDEVKALIEDSAYRYGANHSVSGQWKVRHLGHNRNSMPLDYIIIERAGN